MKKLALVLGAIAASALLAGGAVAAFVVTDNAEKSGIHITPGTLEEDKTGTVTLSWGDMTQFTNITGLRAGTPITRSVVIKALQVDEEEHEVADAVYGGLLDVELKDLSGKTAQQTKLVDYLSIDIKGYEYSNSAFANEKTVLGTIAPGSQSLETSIVAYADKVGKQMPS